VSLRHCLQGALVGALALAHPTDAGAGGDPYLYEPADVEASRAFRYAALSGEACLAELDARKVPYERVPEPQSNVETPLRFTGPIRGVSFAPTYRAERNPKAPATIADCRLALAVDDLASVLAKRGIVEAEYLSMYRPNRLARPGVRHTSALAMDLATVKHADGTTYSVQYDFHGAGGRTCGEGARAPRRDTPGARLWREIACELADMGSFNLLLTPNYDWGHHDHFHLEVRTGIRWVLIH
jgi:hypothetical protein